MVDSIVGVSTIVDMHIALIGGLDRNAHHLEDVARRRGHTLETHTGHVNGRGGEAIASLVHRADLVVVQTDVNSHGGVLTARKEARDQEKALVLVRRLGAAHFKSLLDDLEHGRPSELLAS